MRLPFRCVLLTQRRHHFLFPIVLFTLITRVCIRKFVLPRSLTKPPNFFRSPNTLHLSPPSLFIPNTTSSTSPSLTTPTAATTTTPKKLTNTQHPFRPLPLRLHNHVPPLAPQRLRVTKLNERPHLLKTKPTIRLLFLRLRDDSRGTRVKEVEEGGRFGQVVRGRSVWAVEGRRGEGERGRSGGFDGFEELLQDEDREVHFGAAVCVHGFDGRWWGFFLAAAVAAAAAVVAVAIAVVAVLTLRRSRRRGRHESGEDEGVDEGGEAGSEVCVLAVWEVGGEDCVEGCKGGGEGEDGGVGVGDWEREEEWGGEGVAEVVEGPAAEFGVKGQKDGGGEVGVGCEGCVEGAG